LIIAAVVVIVLAWVLTRQRRTAGLQRQFGPEYHRTVASAENRRAAEAELEERARKHSALQIHPLPEDVRTRYAKQWRSLQEQFVDRPVEVVDAADALLTRVMRERGYPVDDFEQQADLVSVDHPTVVQNYRAAHDVYDRNQRREATTEDLREALVSYRSLFEELLRAAATADERGSVATDDHGSTSTDERKPSSARAATNVAAHVAHPRGDRR